MAWAPRLSHLIKILFRVRDKSAAEGLFMEGSVEFEEGNTETARLMFYYGSRLDPDMAGNFYNYAIASETLKGPSDETVDAWESWLEAAERDPKPPQGLKDKVREHIHQLREDMKQQKSW